MAAGYIRQVLVAIDQVGNAILGGWADETLSARAFRLRYRQPYTFWRAVIDAIFFWQPGHCEAAYKLERKRMQMPPELRIDKEF